MKKNLFFSASLFLLATSCLDESSGAGGKWVESSLRNIKTDTCTVEISTVLADSVTTSGDTLCQIGYYKDDMRGVIRGSTFIEYDLTKPDFTEDVDYLLDSVTITMRPSGHYLGDTLKHQQFHLHRLLETIEFDDYDYLYNVSSVKYDENPFHSFSFRFYPGMREKIEARIPNEYGEHFLELLRGNSLIVGSQEHFRDYFPGIHIRPDDSNSCISGFLVNDSSMCITLYYKKMEETVKELTAVFRPSSSYKFNRVEHDRTGTPFEHVEPGIYYPLPSGDSNNMIYLQGMAGLYNLIEFPYLNNLLKDGSMVTIENALLYFYPVQGTYDDYVPLPEALTLYAANDDNQTQGVITDSSGENVQTGNLQQNTMERNGTYYYFDITSFMQSNLGTFGSNRQKLMLMLPDNEFSDTVKGVVLGDMNHPENKVKLEIIYKIYYQ